jgi:effector-binding domain-containing protein
MPFQCEFENQPSQPTLCVKAHAPVAELPAVLGKAFGEIMGLLESQGQQPAGMPYVAYRNMDMADLDLEIGFPVARPLAGRGSVEPGALPGGTWAATLHVGPYDQVGRAWDALQQFIAASGKKSSGVGYEFYFDGPETPPEKTRTRIMFPLEN